MKRSVLTRFSILGIALLLTQSPEANNSDNTITKTAVSYDGFSLLSRVRFTALEL